VQTHLQGAQALDVEAPPLEDALDGLEVKHIKTMKGVLKGWGASAS